MSPAIETSPTTTRDVLLTGASGYVGGRLLRELLARGLTVRCLARRPVDLLGRVPAGVEVVEGDVLDEASLARAMNGVRFAYYLVHSMGSAEGFEERDRRGAHAFAGAARAQGVERVVYLGGLGDEREALSAHLASRHEVGRILRESGPLTVELRASIVIGSGSLSFELVRALVERLPVMITPRWVRIPTQPVGIGDLLSYLVESLEIPLERSRVFEIGGTDAMSYADLMTAYAEIRGLRRVIIPVPLLSPRLSSLWLGLVTPIYARVGRKLIDSLRHPTIIRDHSAREVFSVRPRSTREAIEAALRNEDREIAATRWSDAQSAGGEPRDWGGARFRSRLLDSRSARVSVDAEAAFEPIRCIGGQRGWYAADLLWRLRGFLDLLVGGVGMRRGRRDPREIAVGDALDFWRVEAFEPGRRLLLRAEMKVPGRAWLEFEVVPEPLGGAVIRQTAMFDPVGLFGLLYWHALWPLHHVVFGGMLRGIAKRGSGDL